MYFAHGATKNGTESTNTLLAVIVMTVVIWIVLLAVVWLVKRFTTWQFPNTNAASVTNKAKGDRK